MRWIAISIMKMMLTKAKNDKYKCNSDVMKIAYDHMIKNYEITILYLESNK
jgi:hypothetical protein